MKEITETVMYSELEKPPSMGTAEFKLAVIRKQPLKRDITQGYQTVHKLKKLAHPPVPPMKSKTLTEIRTHSEEPVLRETNFLTT